MSYRQANPFTVVDIYPFEQNSFTLPQAALLAVTVINTVSSTPGSFTIDLVPGGPNGVDVAPSWSQLITPMSLVVIAMQRNKATQITMIGVVRATQERAVFIPGQPVQRAISVSGIDFGYFFTMFTWYSLWYLGALGVGAQLPGQAPSSALPSILGAAYLTGDPGDIGNAWFTGIMAGQSGVLSGTYVPYQGGQITFPQAMTSFFGKYDVTVPYGEYFISSEGSWIDKFKQIFPFPWYEFFTITAPDPAQFFQTDGNTSTGVGFQTTAFSDLVGYPIVCARRNPLPQLTAEGGSFSGIDTSLWDQLPQFFLESGYLESTVINNEDQVVNFYTLNPTWMRTLFGGPTDANIPFLFNYAAAADTYSIKRYGFRPANTSFNWMTDLQNQNAGNTDNTGLEDLAGNLLARFASYWEPTSLMQNAEVRTWLRPDILPGCKFTYAPYKNGPDWDFYITQVTHSWVMGGPSTTMVSLTRGLPSTVYQDDALLTAIHAGNAEIVNGEYATRSGGASGLTALGLDQFQSFLASIGPPYLNAQTP